MPRLARLDAHGVLHHIMIRGIERRKIFWNDEDRRDFLDGLSTLLPETETSCYAWAFLQNHAHFLFRSGKVPLSTVMRRLLTGYAVRFNEGIIYLGMFGPLRLNGLRIPQGKSPIGASRDKVSPAFRGKGREASRGW